MSAAAHLSAPAAFPAGAALFCGDKTGGACLAGAVYRRGGAVFKNGVRRFFEKIGCRTFARRRCLHLRRGAGYGRPRCRAFSKRAAGRAMCVFCVHVTQNSHKNCFRCGAALQDFTQTMRRENACTQTQLCARAYPPQIGVRRAVFRPYAAGRICVQPQAISSAASRKVFTSVSVLNSERLARTRPVSKVPSPLCMSGAQCRPPRTAIS